MARRSSIRIWSEYALLQALRLILLSFPINLNLRSAKVIGWVWAKLMPGRYQVAVDNLTLALGDEYSHEQIHRLALRSMQNFVMTGIELIQAPRLINRRSWYRYTRLTRIEEFLRLAAEGRPAIMVTGHFGNFELLGQFIACFVGRFASVVRGMDNPLINDYLARTRSHTGLELIFKKGAMAAAEEVLKDGRFLGFLPDQNAGQKGIFVDFFGRKASTHRSVALLACQHEVPVVVGYCRRIGDRFFHELGVERVIWPEEWQDQPDPVVWITEQYVSAIESCVRRCPEQYLWTHRRWKTRPKQEQELTPSHSAASEPSGGRSP